MSSNEASNSSALKPAKLGGSQPGCGPGEHFDERTGTCVQDSAGSGETASFAESRETIADEPPPTK